MFWKTHGVRDINNIYYVSDGVLTYEVLRYVKGAVAFLLRSPHSSLPYTTLGSIIRLLSLERVAELRSALILRAKYVC